MTNKQAALFAAIEAEHGPNGVNSTYRILRTADEFFAWLNKAESR